ncbi:MAG: hypothetical protein ACREIT_05960 [Tepidisphaeraceae bacterium]
MHLYEIYNAEVTWHGCQDMRPWVVVDARPFNMFGCFPLSGECYDGGCFEISANDPDFPATGLAKSCFVHDSLIIEIFVDRFRHRRGALTNELLRRFQEFTGM